MGRYSPGYAGGMSLLPVRVNLKNGNSEKLFLKMSLEGGREKRDMPVSGAGGLVSGSIGYLVVTVAVVAGAVSLMSA